MAFSAKLVMRQGQSLVMTPQLLQAIKLLQLSNLELASFIEEELERNPLLERAEERRGEPQEPRDEPGRSATDAEPSERRLDLRRVRDRPRRPGDEPRNRTRQHVRCASGPERRAKRRPRCMASRATSWTGAPGGSGRRRGDPISKSYRGRRSPCTTISATQLALARADPVDRMIGHALIDAIDEAGYLREPLAAIAERLGADRSRVEAVLAIVQSFEPTGVGARDLAECLAHAAAGARPVRSGHGRRWSSHLELLAQAGLCRPAAALRRRRRGPRRHGRRDPPARPQARPGLRRRRRSRPWCPDVYVWAARRTAPGTSS